MEVGTANNTFNVFNIGRLLSRLQKKKKSCIASADIKTCEQTML